MPAGPVNIPWPLTSTPGFNPQEGAGRLINCHAEPLGTQKNKWIRSPGISAHTADTGFTGYRGGSLVNNLLYFGMSGKGLTVDSSGTLTTLSGSLSGTKMLSIARNQKTPTADIIAVDADNGAFTMTPTTVASYNGSGILPQPNSVCAQDGYFFFGIGDNRVFAAGPNTTTINALTFTTAQSRPNGQLLRVIPFRGMLLIFCTTFIEIWNNTAQPFPAFPYSRLSVLDVGLDGYAAIAGWEDGFGDLLWVFQNGVWRFPPGSFVPEKVSSPDLDRLLKAVSDKTQLVAGCYVYQGKKMWSISSPSWTWELNLNTMKWSERYSFLSNNLLSRWRAVGGTLAFSKWIVGDTQSGKLGYIDDTVYREFGSQMLWRLESMQVEKFPMRSAVKRADFDFVLGTDNPAGVVPIETNPQVMISWSKDGGRNWGPPIARQLGPRGGRPTKRIFATGLGTTESVGRVWRLDITDPVYVSFMGGTMSDTPKAP